MSAIDFFSTGRRTYQAGVDKVVLFIHGRPAVPWFGITAIKEDSAGGDPKPYYLDGVKYLNVSAIEEFKATIEAVDYPGEFLVCDGSRTLAQGLYVTQQKRKPFNLAYRTLIGSDTGVLGSSYKIHLVYNLLASPANRTAATLTDSVDVEKISWSASSTPVIYPGSEPISHMIIDSSIADPDILQEFEKLLYGSEEADPVFPSPDQVVSMFEGIIPEIPDEPEEPEE